MSNTKNTSIPFKSFRKEFLTRPDPNINTKKNCFFFSFFGLGFDKLFDNGHTFNMGIFLFMCFQDIFYDL